VLELQNSDIKVIDAAMKYGYYSPDAFTRAFQSQHGTTPTEMRVTNQTLKVYPQIYGEWFPSSGYEQTEGPTVQVGPEIQAGLEKQPMTEEVEVDKAAIGYGIQMRCLMNLHNSSERSDELCFVAKGFQRQANPCFSCLDYKLLCDGMLNYLY
jgi:hypothetical protein